MDMSGAEERFPGLAILLGAYFNPDWFEDAERWQDVVAEYVALRGGTAALTELDAALPELMDEQTAEQFVDRLGGIDGYSDADERMGPSVLSWLHRLRDELARAVEARAHGTLPPQDGR